MLMVYINIKRVELRNLKFIIFGFKSRAMSYYNRNNNRDAQEDDEDDEEFEQEKLKEKQDEFRRQCKLISCLF